MIVSPNPSRTMLAKGHVVAHEAHDLRVASRRGQQFINQRFASAAGQQHTLAMELLQADAPLSGQCVPGYRQLGCRPACEIGLGQVGEPDDNVRCSQLRRLSLRG